jgi:tRNA isopentenyl-2-thiomethyl-A-37 hydroxylase MiaE
MFAFDIAYEMGDEPVRELLGQKVEQFKVDPSRRNPKHPFFYRPLMVRLPLVKANGPYGPIELERVIKVLPIGAISITVTVPFEVQSLEQLVNFHDLQLGDRSLYAEIRELAERIYVELRPYLIRPLEYLAEEEAYTVFCLESSTVLPAPEVKAEDWLHAHRRNVAGLLTQEKNCEELSEQEANESTSRYISYYLTDLAVIDWDAALVIDEPQDFAEVLYVMELANLHLAELEAYDRLLDRALERSYRDLRTRSRKREMILFLREARIDLARFGDELSNITKFMGDWHLARVHDMIASRFHLNEWHKNVDDKVRTLDNLYQFLQHDQSNRWMLILEAAIVLLFIIDLVAIFATK